METLLIQIDNTPIPKLIGKDVQVFDCSIINTFCSLFSNILVGDIVDENGVPLYKTISPIASLLYDFKDIDSSSFNIIINQWFDILIKILDKGNDCKEQFVIDCPQRYVDWLDSHINSSYNRVGQILSHNHKVFLDATEISEDILAAVNYKINQFLTVHNKEYEFIVFNNNRISNSGHFVKFLKASLTSSKFIRYDHFVDLYMKDLKNKIEKLDDYRAFQIDDLILGISREDETLYNEYVYKQSKDSECYSYKEDHVNLYFDSKTLKRIVVYSHTKGKFEHLFSVIMGETCSYLDYSFNQCLDILSNKGFEIDENPHFIKDYYVSPYGYGDGYDLYRASLIKKNNDFSCKITFTSECPHRRLYDQNPSIIYITDCVDYFRNRKSTALCIEVIFFNNKTER